MSDVLIPPAVVALLLAVVVLSVRLGGYRGGQQRARHPVDGPPPARTSVVDRLVRESVVVTLKSGAAFTGVLWEFDDRTLVLRQAVAAEAGGMVPVDGELLLFVADVAYVQRP